MKIVELATYITRRYAQNKKFGWVKLAKIIYYTDKEHLVRHGETFTGLQYFAFKHGPFTKDIFDLKNEPHIREVPLKTLFGLSLSKSRKIVAEREPDMAVVVDDVANIADVYIQKFWDMDYKQVSQMSHDELGIAWRTAWKKKKNTPIQESWMQLGEPEDIPANLLQELKDITLDAACGVPD